LEPKEKKHGLKKLKRAPIEVEKPDSESIAPRRGEGDK